MKVKQYLIVALTSVAIVGAVAGAYAIGTSNNNGPPSSGVEPVANFTIRWNNAVSDLAQVQVPMPLADPRKVDFATAKPPIPYLEDYTYFWELYNGKAFELKTQAQIVAKDDECVVEKKTMVVPGPLVGDPNNPADTVGIPTVKLEYSTCK